jgi:hypothetical protein
VGGWVGGEGHTSGCVPPIGFVVLMQAMTKVEDLSADLQLMRLREKVDLSSVFDRPALLVACPWVAPHPELHFSSSTVLHSTFRVPPIPSLPFPSLPFPSLPFPSLPFPSLPFPSGAVEACSGAAQARVPHPEKAKSGSEVAGARALSPPPPKAQPRPQAVVVNRVRIVRALSCEWQTWHLVGSCGKGHGNQSRTMYSLDSGTKPRVRDCEPAAGRPGMFVPLDCS